MKPPPILGALLVFLATVSAAIVWFGVELVAAAGNAFVVAGSCFITIRYWRAFVTAVMARDPHDEDYWIAGGVFVAFAVGITRLIRILGLDPSTLAYIFSFSTAVVVFGLYLKATALPFNGRRLSSYAAGLLALLCGSAFLLIVHLLDVVF